jgi:hypothetical protein
MCYWKRYTRGALKHGVKKLFARNSCTKMYEKEIHRTENGWVKKSV